MKHNSKNGFYTGNNLRRLIEDKKANCYKSRDFVQSITFKSIMDNKQVVAISGLRGTGKTIGILQSIYGLGDTQGFDKVAYIEISNPDTSILDLLKGLNRIQYLFIDNITTIKDFVTQSKHLYSFIQDSPERAIFIIGSDPLAFFLSQHYGLGEKLHIIETDFIRPEEVAPPLHPIDDEEMNNTFPAIIKNMKDLKSYVQTAIVDSIKNTIERNPELVNHLEPLNKLSKEELETAIVLALYDYTLANMGYFKSIETDDKSGILSANDEFFIGYFNQVVIPKLGLKELSVSGAEFNKILWWLFKMNVISGIKNINGYSGCRFITNASISQLVAQEISQTIYSDSFNDTSGVLFEITSQGSVKSPISQHFEDLVMIHSCCLCKSRGQKVFYYNNRKIGADLVLMFFEGLNKPADVPNGSQKLILYAAELDETPQIALEKAKKYLLSSDFIAEMSARGIISKVNVIYGKETISGVSDILRDEAQRLSINLYSVNEFLALKSF